MLPQMNNRMPEGALLLERIFSSLDPENDVARQLFREKYLVFLQKNILSWKIRQPESRRSLGDHFGTCLVIYGAKRKRHLACGSSGSFLDGSKSSGSFSAGSPSCEDSLLDASVFESTGTQSRKKDIDYKDYNVCLMPQAEVQDLLKLCSLLGDQNRLKYPVAVFGANGPNMSLIRGCHQTEEGKKWRFNVINPGTVLELEDVPKFETEMKSHRVGFPRNTSVTMDAFAQFTIPFVRQESKHPPCKFMDVDVECYWDSVKKTFEPPSVDGTFFVNVRCIEGDDETGAFERFRELKIVTALSESLESGVMKWSPSPQGSVSMRLEAFLADEKSSLLRRKMGPREEITYAAFGNAVISQRKNLDFVEKLWLILKDSSSSEELVDAFTYVYGKLKEFSKAPNIHADSKVQIASEIKSINQKSIQAPSLDSRSAIVLLLEMGVEKLRRDYITLFHSFDFASTEYLKYFRQSEPTSLRSVSLLKMLHVMVELSYVCFEVLQFPQDQLKEFVRSGLEYFRTVEVVDSKHTFRTQIPAKVALTILNTEILPTTWEVSLASSDRHFKKQTVIRLCKIPRPKRHCKQSALSKSFKESAYIFYRSTLVEDDL